MINTRSGLSSIVDIILLDGLCFDIAQQQQIQNNEGINVTKLSYDDPLLCYSRWTTVSTPVLNVLTECTSWKD